MKLGYDTGLKSLCAGDCLWCAGDCLALLGLGRVSSWEKNVSRFSSLRVNTRADLKIMLKMTTMMMIIMLIIMVNTRADLKLYRSRGLVAWSQLTLLSL